MLNFCQGSSKTLQDFKRNLRENLVALVGASLTSQVIKVTPILPKILTSCPYNCWPLLLRMSVIHTVTMFSNPGLEIGHFWKKTLKLNNTKNWRKKTRQTQELTPQNSIMDN